MPRESGASSNPCAIERNMLCQKRSVGGLLDRRFRACEGITWPPAAACSLSPLPLGRLRPSLTGYGEGWGEGAGHKAQTPGEPPSPRPSPPLGTMRGEGREGVGACGRLHLYDRVPWARQSHGAVDDADHRVGLRKIAPGLAGGGVRVLRHQAEVVSCPQQLFEFLASLLTAADSRQRVEPPESRNIEGRHRRARTARIIIT